MKREVMSAPTTLVDEISHCFTAGKVRALTSSHTFSTWERAFEDVAPGLRISGPVAPGRSTSQATVVLLSRWRSEFTPQTEFGKRLYALRSKAIAAGMRLLSADEVLEEVKRRRGELNAEDEDLR